MEDETLACVSLTATTLEECESQLSRAIYMGADIVEIRIDFILQNQQLDPASLRQWMSKMIKSRKVPLIITNRAAWEGGKCTLPEPERLEWLAYAETLGVDYVDCELKAIQEYEEMRPAIRNPSSSSAPKTQLIISYHDFEKAMTLDELSLTYAKMVQAGADICKIAMMCTNINSNFDLFRLLNAAREPMRTVALGMSEYGQISRIACKRFGAFMTFCSLEAGKESAPGQLALRDMLGLYRFKKVRFDTQMYGVVGNAVQHSMSPAVHNASFDLLDINGLYVPLLVPDAEVLNEMVPRALKSGFKGFSVTIPHKENVMKLVDELDPIAKQIGAINTVVLQSDGRTKGYNTDWSAAMDAVQDAMKAALNKDFLGKNVLMIGAGGAAKGLAYGCIVRGASHLIVLNRTLSRAEQLLADIRPFADTRKCTMEAYDSVDHLVNYNIDVIMNTTSLGMSPHVDETPFPKIMFKKGQVVFDAVYNPLRTRMLMEAEEMQCVPVSGLEMFVGQAVQQFLLWNPEAEPRREDIRNLMRDTVLARIGGRK